VRGVEHHRCHPLILYRTIDICKRDVALEAYSPLGAEGRLTRPARRRTLR
jgi:hypothetical protein